MMNRRWVRDEFELTFIAGEHAHESDKIVCESEWVDSHRHDA